MIRLNTTLNGLVSGSEAVRQHKADKWVWLRGVNEDLFQQMCRTVGQVLWTTQVTHRADAPALVVSNRALRLHTDHHRADVIGWFCHADAEEGGETLLLDLEELYQSFDQRLKASLQPLCFKEHKVFPEDREWHPFHTVEHERDRFYYSFWPAEDTMDDCTQAAYQELRRRIEAQEPVTLRLEPGDALFIDNTRILHGRTAFTGSSRHLTRNWIRLVN